MYYRTTQGEFSYLMFLDHNFVPKKEVIEEELGLEISSQMPFCIRNFELFDERGLNISHGGMKTNIELNEESITINLKHNIEVNTSQSRIEFSDFGITVRNRFWTLVKVADSIVYDQINNIEKINPEYFEALENKYNVLISVYPSTDARIFVYSIVDQITDYNNEPLNFQFASKFKHGQIPNFK